jgi:apoptotic protease-activating factor 1-like protein
LLWSPEWVRSAGASRLPSDLRRSFNHREEDHPDLRLFLLEIPRRGEPWRLLRNFFPTVSSNSLIIGRSDLADWVGEKSPDKLPPEAAEVAKECGYLPLALAMIGTMIRLRPTAWKDALRRLKSADLEAIKRAFPGYPYPDLLRAIEVSVDGLESADRERYLDLTVFPEDQPIPEEALRVLWNLDDADTRDCMTHLVARSLATWVTDSDKRAYVKPNGLSREAKWTSERDGKISWAQAVRASNADIYLMGKLFWPH